MPQARGSAAPRPTRDGHQGGAALHAVAMAVPDRRVTNAEIAQHVGVDEEWISKRTGTSSRPWAQEGERLSDFASRAGSAALERAGLDPAELDLVLVATSTADEITPNAAPLVAGQLGAQRAGALDLGSACTGWLAGLALAAGQIESGRAQHALVIGADFLSRFLDFSDRDTATLFADGAGAAVLSPAADVGGRIGPVVLHSDSAGREWIKLERGGQISMQGQETFRAAVSCLASVTEEAVRAAGTQLDEIDLFVYHQANSRIIRAVGQRLVLDPSRVADYVDRFANSSTATLPIALSVAEEDGRIAPGSRVLVASFGGGFTWGAAVIDWR